MKKPISLHWASSKPNFGDCLSPLIVECISGRKVRHAPPDQCDLMAIGSLLQRAKNHWWNRRIHIWGTGYIESGKVITSRHYIHALRGPSSAARLNSAVTVFGDPGLLADQLLDGRRVEKRHRLSVIAHYKDKESQGLKWLLQQQPDVKLIDVFADPLNVLSDIAASHFVLSSAMHGLIAADALGVPNCRIILSDALRGGNYKFNDYYQGIGMSTPAALDPVSNSLNVEERLAHYSRPGIDLIKQRLIMAFPDI